MYFTDPQFGLFVHTYTPSIALWILSAMLVGVLLYKKKNRDAAVFSIALVLTAVIVWAAKLMFAVPRPEDALVVLTSYAFPSGHAAGGAFLAVMLSWLYIRRKKTTTLHILVVCSFVLLGFMLGYSRLLINVHTPFQVLTGFLLGAAIPLIVVWISSKNYFSFLGK